MEKLSTFRLPIVATNTVSMFLSRHLYALCVCVTKLIIIEYNVYDVTVNLFLGMRILNPRANICVTCLSTEHVVKMSTLTSWSGIFPDPVPEAQFL